MTVMMPRLRKPVLTLHAASSVGWFGAAVVYLAICVIVMTSHDAETLRVLYPVMRKIVWFVILPLNLLSLLTGLVAALYTSGWGLVRHYWVLTKFLLVLGSTLVLLVYTQEIAYYTRKAEKTPIPSADLSVLRGPDGLEHVIFALVVLVVAMVLAVYKPRKLTRAGRRRQAGQRQRAVPASPSSEDVEAHS